MENKTEEIYRIDVSRIFKTLWNKAWMIVIAGLIFAAIGFSLAAFVIAPKYSSSVRLYVNNKDKDNAGNSISSSDITASQSLVRTYSVILNSRSTLEDVIATADVSYTVKQLSKMIEASPVDNTEVMQVTVKCGDPEEAARIAEAVCTILPDKIEDIIKGAEMKVVDHATVNNEKVAPSVAVYTVIALVLGVLASIATITVRTLMDDRIHDEEYVLQNYDCPVLAKIPDLVNAKGKRYGYYYQHHDENKK